MKPERQRRLTVPEGMSPVFLPIGTISENQVAVIGSMGEFFIHGGSNAAIAQYARWDQPDQQPELERIVAGWTSLIRGRHERVSAMGARFFQTLIPEKSSLYPHMLPAEYTHITGPTAALARINRDLSTNPDWYVDAFSVLDGDTSNDRMWPRTGSHWTPAGARALTVDIVRRIDPRAAAEVGSLQLTSSAEIESDLGKHMLGSRISERAPAPDLGSMPFGNSLTQLEMSYDGESKWSSWRCDDALIDQRVIVFGNSYTQVIPIMDRLSWWIARVFRESQFIWTPEVKDEIIEDYKPDVVIAQGIERFLPTIPAR